MPTKKENKTPSLTKEDKHRLAVNSLGVDRETKKVLELIYDTVRPVDLVVTEGYNNISFESPTFTVKVTVKYESKGGDNKN